MIKLYCSLILVLCCNLAFSTDKVTIDSTLDSKLIGQHVSYLEDETGALQFNDIRNSSNFQQLHKEVANFSVSKSTFWLRFTIANKNNSQKNYIEVVQPLLDVADFYYPGENNKYEVTTAGLRFPFHHRKYQESANFLFDLDLKPGEEKTFYLKIKGQEQILVPVQIVTEASVDRMAASRTVWFGVYCGI